MTQTFLSRVFKEGRTGGTERFHPAQGRRVGIGPDEGEGNLCTEINRLSSTPFTTDTEFCGTPKTK